ncbi:Fpg/Nei family DNA glycosylase [Acidipila sp. EB88]|uniref:Fpg/Nei family DNA glycosylase n=1 Tax=Acidipila sp. EB88 TaxID=2305226 RepID=UPI000F5FB73A|nr:zinc finger domain-containing protein [Acidipila sp. EB88]RRA48949.1 Fpg/Nei family DNA glycosylase [Acidipila sp. EB88]
MPEGHEIHRFALRQAEAFAGKKVHVDSPNGGFPDAGVLDGRKLLEVRALGKHLGYHFGKDLTVHVHLGQFGDFWEGQQPMPEPKGALRFRMWTRTDWLELRGPTNCRIFSDQEWTALEQRIGPDPLVDGTDPAAMFALVRSKKTPIGVLLMDQKVVSGIGNIYRAEFLYRARIHPDRPGRDVSLLELKGVWKDAVTLMRDGMDDRRMVTTRAKHRPHPRGVALDEEVHYVYRRQGKPCRVCGTEIESKAMAGRTVYWCPTCQKD